MSNRLTATKKERSNDSSEKNAQVSASQKAATTSEQTAKNPKGPSTQPVDGNKAPSTLKTNSHSHDSSDARKEVSKSQAAKK